MGHKVHQHWEAKLTRAQLLLKPNSLNCLDFLLSHRLVQDGRSPKLSLYLRLYYKVNPGMQARPGVSPPVSLSLTCSLSRSLRDSFSHIPSRIVRVLHSFSISNLSTSSRTV